LAWSGKATQGRRRDDPERDVCHNRGGAVKYWQAAIFVLIYTTAQAAGQSHINGVCGPANGLPIATAPSRGRCTYGTPSAVTQSNSSWILSCKGSRGGSTAQRSGPFSSAPSIVLTITPSPTGVQATAPLGSFVAAATPRWSNGAQFTGQVIFASPNFSAGGAFALSGDDILLSESLAAWKERFSTV
jgi:hypothetical protein